MTLNTCLLELSFVLLIFFFFLFGNLVVRPCIFTWSEILANHLFYWSKGLHQSDCTCASQTPLYYLELCRDHSSNDEYIISMNECTFCYVKKYITCCPQSLRLFSLLSQCSQLLSGQSTRGGLIGVSVRAQRDLWPPASSRVCRQGRFRAEAEHCRAKGRGKRTAGGVGWWRQPQGEDCATSVAPKKTSVPPCVIFDECWCKCLSRTSPSHRTPMHSWSSRPSPPLLTSSWLSVASTPTSPNTTPTTALRTRAGR